MSSNKEIFEETKPAQSDALNKSRFKEKLSYISTKNNNDKNDNKQQKPKIIWYNPLYSPNTKAHIG